MKKGSPVVKKVFAGVLAGCLAALLGRCAGQVPPGGGPTDTTAPEIIRTKPSANAVNVAERTIEIEFSEYVERRTVEESIFISPYVGELEFDWSGTEVAIRFSEPLQKNRTYVVNVGTDVVDRRAKNRMASGFTLAFSTGDSIDTGLVRGRVYDAKPEGVMIFTYQLDGLDADTFDPAKTRPDYIMQTGKNGLFSLSNIPDGTFRLFAIRDEYRDLIYNKQVDAYGVASADVIVSPENRNVENVHFRLTREDTTKPFITSVQNVDLSRVQVRFSEPLDSVYNATAALVDTSTGSPAAIRLVFVDPATSSAISIVTTSPLDSGAPYRVSVAGVSDTAGNPLDSLHAEAVFVASGSRDTIPPVVSVAGLRDSIRGIRPEDKFAILFSEPVGQPALQQAILLLDSTGHPVSSHLVWKSVTQCLLASDLPLMSGAWYSLTVILDSVRDFQGNSPRDSILTVRFQTLDTRSTGVVEGTVVDEKKDGTGVIFVTARAVDQTQGFTRTIQVKGPGRFQFGELLEGRYVLSAFRDQDSSGTYTFGMPFPYQPSERFAVVDDTLKVRARWSVEGVLLRFR